jgi:hypothetical protein
MPAELPPQPDYASKGTPQPQQKELGDLGAPQVIFDTVTGPNLRLRDNLIQLVSVIVAVVLTFLVMLIVTRDLAISAGVGVMGGALVGVLISGAALGIYRLVKGISRK